MTAILESVKGDLYDPDPEDRPPYFPSVFRPIATEGLTGGNIRFFGYFRGDYHRPPQLWVFSLSLHMKGAGPVYTIDEKTRLHIHKANEFYKWSCMLPSGSTINGAAEWRGADVMAIPPEFKLLPPMGQSILSTLTVASGIDRLRQPWGYFIYYLRQDSLTDFRAAVYDPSYDRVYILGLNPVRDRPGGGAAYAYFITTVLLWVDLSARPINKGNEGS